MARIKTTCYLTQGDYENIAFAGDTVASAGCGVCTLAMHILNKASGKITDSFKEKVVEAVAESSLFNSDGYMWAPPQSITLTIDNKSYSIGYTKTNDIAAEILNDKTGFVYFTASSGKKTASHFVLVDGIDRTESDPLRKLLVVDPSYGDSRTLYDAMVANYEYCGLTNVTPSTSHLNSNFKCVFD